VRTPLSARIGVYLSLTGLVFDLILNYAGGLECLAPAIGEFSTFFSPPGLILLVGTAILQLIVLRHDRTDRICIGGFEGEKGAYDFHLQILSDGSCLNPGHPRSAAVLAGHALHGVL
jgi:hypothetical protein